MLTNKARKALDNFKKAHEEYIYRGAKPMEERSEIIKEFFEAQEELKALLPQKE